MGRRLARAAPGAALLVRRRIVSGVSGYSRLRPRRREHAMGFLDKAKAAAEQAAAKAKEGVEDVQTKRDLGQAYGELGKLTFGLMESGQLTHPTLETTAAKIRGLNAK